VEGNRLKSRYLSIKLLKIVVLSIKILQFKLQYIAVFLKYFEKYRIIDKWLNSTFFMII
jgi:hypothetical protein